MTADEALLVARLCRNLWSLILTSRSPADAALLDRARFPEPGDLVVEISGMGPVRDPDSVGRLIRVEGDDPADRIVVEPLHRPGEEQGWQNAVFVAVPDIAPLTAYLARKSHGDGGS